MEPCNQSSEVTATRQRGREHPRWETEGKKISPLVDEGELAVDGAARDELGRLDCHTFGRLVGAVGQRPTHRHQAGQIRVLWSLGVAFLLQLLFCPGVHVAGAVEGAELV